MQYLRSKGIVGQAAQQAVNVSWELLGWWDQGKEGGRGGEALEGCGGSGGAGNVKMLGWWDQGIGGRGQALKGCGGSGSAAGSQRKRGTVVMVG